MGYNPFAKYHGHPSKVEKKQINRPTNQKHHHGNSAKLGDPLFPVKGEEIS